MDMCCGTEDVGLSLIWYTKTVFSWTEQVSSRAKKERSPETQLQKLIKAMFLWVKRGWAQKWSPGPQIQWDGETATPETQVLFINKMFKFWTAKSLRWLQSNVFDANNSIYKDESVLFSPCASCIFRIKSSNLKPLICANVLGTSWI